MSFVSYAVVLSYTLHVVGFSFSTENINKKSLGFSFLLKISVTTQMKIVSCWIYIFSGKMSPLFIRSMRFWEENLD